MCTAIPIISTANDLIDAGVISLFWGSKARWGALKREEFIFIFVTSLHKLICHWQIYQESMLKVEYLVHQLSISLFHYSRSMHNAQTFLYIFNSKKQKKKY